MVAIDEHANAVLSTDFIGVYRPILNGGGLLQRKKKPLLRLLFTFLRGFFFSFRFAEMKISFKNAILTYTNSIWIQFYIPSPTHTQLCNFHSEVKYNFSERNVGVQRFKNDNQHLFYTLVDIVRLPTIAEIYTFFFSTLCHCTLGCFAIWCVCVWECECVYDKMLPRWNSNAFDIVCKCSKTMHLSLITHILNAMCGC